jgi:hypothetical protein
MNDAERKELRATPGCGKKYLADCYQTSSTFLNHDMALEYAKQCPACLDLFVSAVRSSPREPGGEAKALEAAMREMRSFVNAHGVAFEAATYDMRQLIAACRAYHAALSAPPSPSGPPTGDGAQVLKSLRDRIGLLLHSLKLLEANDGPGLRQYDIKFTDAELYDIHAALSGPPRREPSDLGRILDNFAHAVLRGIADERAGKAVAIAAITAWAGPVSPSERGEMVEKEVSPDSTASAHGGAGAASGDPHTATVSPSDRAISAAHKAASPILECDENPPLFRDRVALMLRAAYAVDSVSPSLSAETVERVARRTLALLQIHFIDGRSGLDREQVESTVARVVASLTRATQEEA